MLKNYFEFYNSILTIMRRIVLGQEKKQADTPKLKGQGLILQV